MKKLFIGFAMVLLCFIFSSCRVQETYRLLNPQEEISEISIISISFDGKGSVRQTELRKVDDQNAFLNDFRNVDCYIYFGDPTGITEEGVQANVIKFTYSNGEYELINWNGQADYTHKNGFNFYAGLSVFNEAQFQALITKYSN